MHIINVNVTTEMFYMRLVCALKSSVCFTLKSTSQFAPSHFKCPVALHVPMGLMLARAALEAVSLSILQSELGRLPGCCLGLWDH